MEDDVVTGRGKSWRLATQTNRFSSLNDFDHRGTQILQISWKETSFSDFFLSHFGYISCARDQPIFTKDSHKYVLGDIIEEQVAKDHYDTFVFKSGREVEFPPKTSSGAKIPLSFLAPD